VTKNIRFLNWFEEALVFTRDNNIPRGNLGKLGFKDEPAGKVRVFAMVDCVTQWVLKPLHDRIFEILRLIPQDGTFDQERPLAHLSELGERGSKLYSFDLSAATDRLPVLIQATLLSTLIGAWGANLWMNLLVSRPYSLPERGVKASGLKEVWYAVGQPMGALTSWASLALTHHALVQWAAYRASVITDSWFEDYAILGDDVVIADSRVADEYLVVLTELGVRCGLHKSLVSPIGALEFAKRFIVKGVNLSPVPLRELWAGLGSLQAAFELARKYTLSVTSLASVLGFGYKAVGSMTSPLSRLGSRLRNLLILSRAPGSLVPLPLTQFLSFSGVESVREFGDPQRQSLFDKFKGSLLERIDQLRPRLDVIRALVTVDRTRAHYGTIDFSPKLEGYSFPFYEKLDSKGRRFMHTLFEYVYREFFLDVLCEVRDARTTIEELTLETSDAEFEGLIETLVRLDIVLGSLPLMPHSSLRIQPRRQASVGRWLKMWKSV